MQILIDIPEDFYEALKKTDEISSGLHSEKTLMSVIYSAVAKGTPFPEEHGRIIDESKITKCEQIGLVITDDNVKSILRTDAPTIVEADRVRWSGPKRKQGKNERIREYGI